MWVNEIYLTPEEADYLKSNWLRGFFDFETGETHD